MCAKCETVCFCVRHYSLCESHPLTTGTELSLIQLCLLSCLLAAPAPWCSSGSAMAFPYCFFFICLWPHSRSRGLPFLALSLFFSPRLVAALVADNSTCLFSFLFFSFLVSVVYSSSKLLLRSACSAKLLLGIWREMRLQAWWKRQESLQRSAGTGPWAETSD